MYIIKPQKKNAICKAKSFYGDAKLKTTKFLINQYNLKNLPVTVFRLYQTWSLLRY